MSEEMRPFPPILRPGPRLDLLNQLRAYAGEFQELARHSARGLGLHTTDANALVEVLSAERLGHPLSPARLSERVGLTSGATNALVNRLENAGYVVRTREHTDRRQVTLRTTELARDRAEAIYTEPARLLEATLDGLEPEVLEQLTGALTLLTGTLTQVNQQMAAAHEH
ncbi:MarR family transcriptional regulator [Kineosporia rhizophila]|uniref:MarR family winged helix-turn-helix transcriptional regulator n=1 Tax=Kineosporia TaxID=49184 RepID=UPI001E349FCE|nr:MULTISPECIES: MarR family transcriptional regulator [Kineosporia]MCE0534559.1 MarR family transcriptional regulator [Kineosporia rhizophila]GLY15653.1 hypothetical protein Kisp01_26680 [Kineosporia sp. NBRC 101677]